MPQRSMPHCSVSRQPDLVWNMLEALLMDCCVACTCLPCATSHKIVLAQSPLQPRNIMLFVIICLVMLLRPSSLI